MKIAFIFPGQGAQTVGMFKDLYDTYKEVSNAMDRADIILKRSITGVCFNGTQEELSLTHNTQPCLLATELAAADLLLAHNVIPEAVAGFSLGEYAALTVAGVISREDVFPLIQYRADIMQEAVPEGQGGMVAVIGAEQSWLENICEEIGHEKLAIANYNSPQQIVLAGTIEGIEEILNITKEKRIRAMRLPVSVPSHCTLMKDAAKQLGDRLSECTFDYPQIPVYMNYNGKKLVDSDNIEEFLALQLSNAVQWVRTLNNMKDDGIDTFIECGPGKVLSGLVKKNLKDVNVLHVGDMGSFNQTLQELKK